MLLMVTIGEVIGITFFFIFMVVVLYHFVRMKIRQTFCYHKKYYETMACQAVCSDCGKNLGFIGAVRERSK